MKTISIAQFETLVARDDWQREQSTEIVERHVRQIEEYDANAETLNQIDVPHVWGWACKSSTLDGVTITYTEGFNYDEYTPDSLSTGTEGADEVWTVEGIVVVDDDGDKLDASELCNYLNCNFDHIDYRTLAIEQVTDVDVDVGSDAKTFTLAIDYAPSIRFTGELVASVANSDEEVMGSSYSGQVGRWTVLSLYKTKGEKYVCYQVDYTRWQGERDRIRGEVCETLTEVKEFFGHSRLAGELYMMAIPRDE